MGNWEAHLRNVFRGMASIGEGIASIGEGIASLYISPTADYKGRSPYRLPKQARDAKSALAGDMAAIGGDMRRVMGDMDMDKAIKRAQQTPPAAKSNHQL